MFNYCINAHCKTFLIVIDTVDMADGRNEVRDINGVFSAGLLSLSGDGSIVNTGRSLRSHDPYILLVVINIH